MDFGALPPEINSARIYSGAAQLARQLGAPVVRLEQLHADYLVHAVRGVA